MSIAPTPSGGFKVRWRDVTGKHRSKTFPKGRLEEARKYERDRKYDVDHGGFGLPNSKITLLEVGTEFAEKFLPTKAPKTQTLYKSLWNAWILPELGDQVMSRMTTGDVEDWLSRIEVGATTKRKSLVLLGQIFRFAMKRGYVAHNPTLLADRPTMPAREPIMPLHPLAVERIRQEFLKAGQLREATITSVLAYAGLRPLGEALSLRWDDIRDRTLLVRAPKTSTHRAVPILEPLALDLERWQLASDGTESPYLFPNHKGGKWTDTTYGNWRKRVWGEVADTCPKNLRHTYVSLLLADPNILPLAASRYAGHSMKVQDDHYAHLIPELEPGDATEAIFRARSEVFGERVKEEA
jgi:integrase